MGAYFEPLGKSAQILIDSPRFIGLTTSTRHSFAAVPEFLVFFFCLEQNCFTGKEMQMDEKSPSQETENQRSLLVLASGMMRQRADVQNPCCQLKAQSLLLFALTPVSWSVPNDEVDFPFRLSRTYSCRYMQSSVNAISHLSFPLPSKFCERDGRYSDVPRLFSILDAASELTNTTCTRPKINNPAKFLIKRTSMRVE
jgi:hypothetical protein